jgi:Rrf2 family transcriptional regulator, iron-sulfur cluster assembly transcription factor
MFSTSCHYGLQAMLYIAMHATEESNVELKVVAEEQDIPRHFLSKILQQLVKNDLLISMKGPTGGFRLARPAEKITLIEIIAAIDGLGVFNKCGIGFKQCNDKNPCPIHDDYKKVRAQVENLFRSKNLQNLIEDVKEGNSIISISG